MPKRTNSFQQFIHDLEKLLAPQGAIVEESGMVLDRSISEKVEVDIVVRIPGGPREVVIGIECRDRKRPADIAWIDELATRKQNLELDRLVAVSRLGFTARAEKKAKQLGIETIKMKAKKLVRWISFFAFLRFIQIEENITPFFDAISVRFLDEPGFRSLTIEETKRANVCRDDGTPVGSLAAFGDVIAKASATNGFLAEHQPFLGSYHFNASYRMKPGYKLEYQGARRSLAELNVRLRVSRRVHTVPVEHFDYHNAQAASAKFDLFGQGTVEILLGQTEGGTPKIMMKMGKQPPSNVDEPDNSGDGEKT